MRLGARVLLLSLLAALSAAFVTAAPAAAFIEGGCSGTATASGSGTADLTTIQVWHLKSTDVVNGSGTAPTQQTHIDIGAYVLGYVLPVFSNTGKSQGGKAGPYHVSDYSKYGRVIAVSGATDSCSGSMTVIVDDVSPVGNALGLVSLILAVLGIGGVLATMFSGSGCFMRILGLILGLLGGLGAGELLVQFGVLDPRAPYGIAIPIVLAIIGALVPGVFHRAPAAPAAPPA